ncbi:uncharacterized protein K452DRAFT_4112 [Aplosporella prunicola CBS 121167]|uniref:Heterokaryon incompatibility domain-containing protein n=1 Tax=Aplosporella prunicola CBS 121167 TaxID=1176127 RepID=A0A6A6BT26_9PEZI|nr:uncharacterized protein K452DRAFT_4112 [Aplosporella prunicola CBS 121167]KAF2147246.1 hypothetical protein K452DRAFT_4112 [Aplosporella prunicola CBS 121167]
MRWSRLVYANEVQGASSMASSFSATMFDALGQYDALKMFVWDSLVPKKWEYERRRARLERNRYAIEQKWQTTDHINFEYNDAPMYEYQPLVATASIRLLIINPGSLDEHIDCSMQEYPLDECPAFSALSYTWGSQIQDHRIYTDGKVLGVTQNLWHALWRLRSPDTQQVLWIDAVCINQKDHRERGEQVRQMERIYSQAAIVTIWLGEESEDSALAFELTKRVYSVAKDDPLSEINQKLGAEGLARKGLPEPNSADWRAFEVLFRRPWFRRCWIIQEIVLAQEAMVVCGSQWVWWEELKTAAWYIRMHSIPVNHTVNITSLTAYQRRYREGRNMPLLELLLFSTANGATDPRDKVYSFLGICSSIDSCQILPDYNASTEEVYRETALMHLRRGNLDILNGLADLRYRITPGLPSWVPDWAFESRTKPLVPGLVNAGGSGDASFRLSEDSRTLFLSGVRSDTVRTVGGWMAANYADMAPGRILPHMVNDVMLVDLRVRLLLLWQRLASTLDTYPTGETVMEAFQRTIVASIQRWREEWEIGPHISTLYDALMAARLDPAFTMPEDPLWQKYAASTQEDPITIRTAAINYATAFKAASPERRFFVTRKGYMGLGPRSTRPGDKICVFVGAKTPFVLRQRKNGLHQAIGECYVHGIMHGESLVGDNPVEEVGLA